MANISLNPSQQNSNNRERGGNQALKMKKDELASLCLKAKRKLISYFPFCCIVIGVLQNASLA